MWGLVASTVITAVGTIIIAGLLVVTRRSHVHGPRRTRHLHPIRKHLHTGTTIPIAARHHLPIHHPRPTRHNRTHKRPRTNHLHAHSSRDHGSRGLSPRLRPHLKLRRPRPNSHQPHRNSPRNRRFYFSPIANRSITHSFVAVKINFQSFSHS
jgi:hypothetical protein